MHVSDSWVCARAPFFVGWGRSKGAPTHQPAFSFDQTKHQTLTDALCHVLLYIDRIVRNA